MNKYIDHTLLKPEATKEQIAKLCQEAKEYDFMSVCVNPGRVKECVEALKGSDVKVCTVIGFPLGATTTLSKVNEAKEAQENGATEFDMVLNIGALKEGNYDLAREDIRKVKEAIGKDVLKVIIETCILTDEEIVKASELCVEAGADFVKTSTGFNTAGANPRVVKIMKNTVGDKALVKAAGGVKTPDDLKEMIEAGADRIGTSSGVKLMQGNNAEGGY